LPKTGELDFIAALRALATDPAARGLNDDCAVLPFGGETLVLTHDAMVAGVHFLPDADATNISDLAAKGAEPLGVLLSYQLGGDEARFLEGLREALAFYRAPLLGGDTVGGAGGQVLGLTALGRATYTPVPGRDGARAGDVIYITGPVGAAMIGLEALQARASDPALSEAYRRPRALLDAGIALAPHVSAMMDVSDGLLLDATRMAQASGVSFAITSALVPIATPEARRAEALRWGDDYQLLFTARPGTALPVPATMIGTVCQPSAAPLLLDDAPPEGSLGYAHQAR
jgi:thiamine-monophosphate kinase